MNSIIFIGTNKSGSSREAIKAAEDMGYFTCLLTNNSIQLQQREQYPDVHLMQYCDLEDYERTKKTIIELQGRALKINTIISFIDPWCGLAAKLSQEFNIGRFSSSAITLMENKKQSRERLKHTAYPPKYFFLDNKKEVSLKLPVVVKYTKSNGSKDVYYCKDLESYRKYTKKILDKYQGGEIIVEEYLDGPQYLVECLVIDKTVEIIAIIHQEITHINEHFIVTGYQLLIDEKDSFYIDIQSIVEDIIKIHSLETGACHLELRYVEKKWKLIEINPRISGAGMNQLIYTGLGINLVKETLKLALYQPLDLKPKHKIHIFSEYIILRQKGRLVKVSGKNQVLDQPGVKQVYIKPRKGSILTPPTSLGHRYAYVIATGENSKQARINAKSAAANIIFHITNI